MSGQSGSGGGDPAEGAGSRELSSPGEDRGGPAVSLFGRRDFLGRAGLLGLGAALLGGLAIGLRSLWPRAGQARSLAVPAGRPEEYLVGQVSGRLLAEHQVWVARSARGFFAFSAICTHLGCRLRHHPGSGEYRCMCHGSSFSAEGDVLAGPAARPLERVAIRLGRDGELQIEPSLRYRKERGEWALPGAFLLYPGGKRT